MNKKILQRTGFAIGVFSVFGVGGCEDLVVENSFEEDIAVEASSHALTVATDFRVGIQLADNGSSQPGDWVYTSTYEGSNGSMSSWACDGNCYDPDSARLTLTGYTSDDVAGKDFRICMQASDNGTNHNQLGPVQCTPWASDGGGTTGLVTDSNGYDPDSYRISIETRNWPDGLDRTIDLRLRMRAWDNSVSGTWSTWTGWASAGGSTTSWACDSNCYDPDGFEIHMEVTESSVWSFCSPSHKCQHGFGDCDSNSDCISGTTCVSDVGQLYGYSDNSIDVCVD